MFNSLLDFFFPHRKNIRDLESDVFTLKNEINEIKKLILEEDEKKRTKTPLTKEERLLSFLTVPRTTQETARYFVESRTWISLQLNKLERKGKIREVSRSVKGKFYQTIK